MWFVYAQEVKRLRDSGVVRRHWMFFSHAFCVSSALRRAWGGCQHCLLPLFCRTVICRPKLKCRTAGVRRGEGGYSTPRARGHRRPTTERLRNQRFYPQHQVHIVLLPPPPPILPPVVVAFWISSESYLFTATCTYIRRSFAHHIILLCSLVYRPLVSSLIPSFVCCFGRRVCLRVSVHVLRAVHRQEEGA